MGAAMFLGVDGGGTKTAFALVDAHGTVLAQFEASSAYFLEVGMAATTAMLARGCAAVLDQAGVAAADVTFSFFGLPSYGEDRAAQAQLDALPRDILGHDRYRCGNDMVCSWAGSLACEDGISVIAGTGSMAYGEYGGKQARAGGWGELFSDEGSAYWIARAGLALFSRMSDGRSARGPLYDVVRAHFELEEDLDVCAAVYGTLQAERSRVAQLARLVSAAAALGDVGAGAILEQAAVELADMVDAVRASLGVAPEVALPVSFTGGLFAEDGPLRAPFARALAARALPYRLTLPKLAPVLGAALYAARLADAP
jgi:N-acetylglucosamine kinase-like BadF-type ATPase